MEYILAVVFLTINSVSDMIKRQICLLTVVIFAAISVIGIGLSRDKLFAMALGIIIMVVSRISKGFGMGDAIVIFTVGLIVGLVILLKMLLYASILASVFGGILLLLKKGTKKSEIPFIPFMLVGIIAGVLL